MAGIVGMAVFTQYWYWFPFTHFLSLSFSPTSVIGLDQDLHIPDFRFHCATRPSLFDYPPEQEVKAEAGPTLMATAILSTTAQAKRRAQMKERAARRDSMDIDSTPTLTKTAAPPTGADKMDVDDERAKGAEEPKDKKEGEGSASAEKDPPSAAESKKKVEKEKVGYEMENMSRVLPGQLKYISFPDARYRPAKKPTGGPLLLLDTQTHLPKNLIDEKLLKVTTEKAPVAGPQAAGASGHRGGLAREQRNAMNLRGEQADIRSINELFRQSAQEGGGTLPGFGVLDSSRSAPRPPPRESGSGAAAAAGVLTALDEDNEGDEEAPVPGDFEYFTDPEEDDV